MTDKALRYNEGKPELRLLLEFGEALDHLTQVMSQGAIKYSPRNWLKGGKDDAEYLDSAMRHMRAMVNNELFDKDTGCAHAAHVAWNMLAMLRCNYPWLVSLDPDFDQASFEARYRVEAP